ncbi:MAG: hypothetical protein A2138_05855 [Deltaproteobacteria bacterium RBG_16_71_12]|nr:MAG: hypothetical protein A2138_05855 [Deltaproteobacteria bacterium RBG_16_71_12]
MSPTPLSCQVRGRPPCAAQRRLPSEHRRAAPAFGSAAGPARVLTRLGRGNDEQAQTGCRLLTRQLVKARRASTIIDH